LDRPASPSKKQHKQSIDSEKAESDKGDGEVKPEGEKKVFRPKGVGKHFYGL